jgi:hypothetical protein
MIADRFIDPEGVVAEAESEVEVDIEVADSVCRTSSRSGWSFLVWKHHSRFESPPGFTEKS